MDNTLTNIEEYYEQVKGEYDIDFTEFKRICTAPFEFVKDTIAKGSLKNIRFQYFGVFGVLPSRVKYSKQSLEASYNNGTISEERYHKRMNILENYEE